MDYDRNGSAVVPLLSIALAAALHLMSTPGGASARELRVPSQFPTIQEAVDAAAAGDTVLVGPGTYGRTWTRNLSRPSGEVEITANVFIERPIALVSQAGPEGTTVSGGGNGPVMVVRDARGVVIEGFTISGGNADERLIDGGGGIFCELSDVEISNNIIENNSAPFGAGIACFTGSAPWIHDNIIRDNDKCEFGGAVALMGGSSGSIESNVIAGNVADVFGGGILVNEQSSAVVESNTIVGNHATAGSAVFCRDGSDARVSGNIIAMGSGGAAVYCDTLVTSGPCAIVLSCNDYWDNSGGDVEGCLPGVSDRHIDPFFCSYESSDFTLCAFSPCLGAGDSCGRRGALRAGCLWCEVQERRLSWGLLKVIYK